MSEFSIKSGDSGQVARVDSNKRIHAHAVSLPENEKATEDEDSYNINSGLLTLTTADESGILYVKNNETRNLHISGIVTIFGPSTNGVATDTVHVRIYKGITAGTLQSEAVAAPIQSNRNFGSSDTLTADMYKGGEGKTITGTSHIESLVSPGNRVFFAIDEILQKGNSIAISYEPQDSNSSMKVMAAVICHLEDPNNL